MSARGFLQVNMLSEPETPHLMEAHCEPSPNTDIVAHLIQATDLKY